MKADIKLLVGPTMSAGGSRRVRIAKLIGIISAILTSGFVGANLSEWLFWWFF